MTLSRADGTLTATWNAPANAAAYHVTYTTNNGQSWSLGAMDHTQTTWTLSNADNDATYVVGVRARNSSNDWSGWTNSPSSGPYNAPPPPGAVASVTVSRADGALTATWNAPANAAAYHVTYTTNNGQSWSLGAMDHAQTTWTLDTADNDATYVVGVRARNSANAWSGWVNSAASGPYVPPVTSPPAAPTGLSATAGDGSVVLAWDDPSDASISGYEYQVNHNDTSTGKFSGWGAWTAIANSGAATTSHTLSGLTNGAEYRYRLRAVNAAGAGATAPNAKPWYVTATPDGAPSISVTNVTATSATLNLNNHSGAWYYQASGGSGGGSGGASANSSDPPDDCIGPVNGQANLTHLGTNTTYTITVYGDQCQGGAMAAGSFNTLQGTLADPTGITVYRGYDATRSANARGTMDVEWGAVPNATGYKVAYTRNWHDFLGEVTVSGGSTTAAKLTGFDHSKYYWVVVKATGAGSAESGWGWSAISYAAMPPRPIYVMTLTRADAGLQVGWKQCNVTEGWCNGGSPVTGFQIDLSDDGGTTWTKVWEAASVTVTNYAPDANGITTGDASATVCANTGKSYRVRIGVTNRMATAWSEASAASSTVGTYTPTAGARHTACDFNTLAAAGNTNPYGIWSNGTTMWVVDQSDNKAYAYNQATKARDTGKDITLAATGILWSPLTSDGTTLWVVDLVNDDKLFAYSISGKAADSSKDLTLHADNDTPDGMWTNGVTMWVVDSGDDKIYAYTLATGARDDDKDISLHSSNTDAQALWSDGVTMWVLDGTANNEKIYAYKMSDGSRDSAKDYTSLDSGNTGPYGIWSDETTMWISNSGNPNNKLFAYHATAPKPLAPASVSAYRGNGFIDVAWSAVSGATGYDISYSTNGGFDWSSAASGQTGTSYRIASTSNSHTYKVRVRAGNANGKSGWTHSALNYPAIDPRPVYDMTLTRADAGLQVGWKQCNVTEGWCNGGSPVTGFQIDLSGDGGSTWTKVWEATTVTVSNYAPDAYGIVTGDASITVCSNPSKSYRVRIGVTNRMATAWSQASTANSTVGTHTPTPGARHTACDFNTLSAAGNTEAKGIWSDGATMWVVDFNDKLYAYNLATKARDAAKDISLDSSKSYWTYITSDGTTAWVWDSGNSYDYFAYNLNTRAPDTSKNINTFTTDHDTPAAMWTDGTTMWVVDDVTYQGAAQVRPITLSTGARDTNKDFSLHLDNDSPAGLWSDGVTLWVVDLNKVYAYTLSNGNRDTAKEYTLDSQNTTGVGIWSDGATTWVSNSPSGNADKIYAYHSKSPGTGSAGSAGARSDNPAHTPIVAGWRLERDGAGVLRVTAKTDSSPNRAAAAATPAPGSRDEGNDVTTLAAAGNTSPDGLWSDGATLWVVDTDDRMLYAYDLASKARDPGKDVAL